MRKPLFRNIAFFIILLGIGSYGLFSKAGSWLSKADSLQKADVLICLGGTEERIKKCIELYKKGLAPHIIATETKDKRFFLEHGIPENHLSLLPEPINTYQEAQEVFPVLRQRGYHTVLLVTDPFRIQRARWSFQRIIHAQPVKLLFVASSFPFTPDRWWEDKTSRFYVALEVSKNIYYWTFHGLFDLKNDPDWAVHWKIQYEQTLRKIFL